MDEGHNELGDSEILGLKFRWANSPNSRELSKPPLLQDTVNDNSK
jgi:hypothetical protein